MQKRTSGDLWAIFSALTTGSGLIAAKAVLLVHNPLTFNTYLFSLGMVVISIDALFSRQLFKTINATFRQVSLYFYISLLFCCATFCFFTALSLAEPATVSFLSRLEMVSTVILAIIFLKERFHPAEIIGLIIVIIGLVVMRYRADVELSRAFLLALLGSLFYGIAEVTIKNFIDRINYRSFIFYRNLFMGAIYFAAANLMGKFAPIRDSRLIILTIIAAILLPYCGRLGYLKAMQRINISRATIIVQSQPFFAALTALIFLGTFPGWREVCGGMLIVVGVIVIKILERRADRRLASISP